MRVINSFRGNYDFLSNFFVGAPIIDCNRIKWITTEHYYQAMKTKSLEIQKEIRNSKTPKKAARIGRSIEIRKDWDIIKAGVMRVALDLKFGQHEKFREYLIQTEGYKLVEGNWWHDNFWGDCYCDKCESKKGKNMLGKMLMSIRDGMLL